MAMIQKHRVYASSGKLKADGSNKLVMEVMDRTG
jgi:hypothetical protein